MKNNKYGISNNQLIRHGELLLYPATLPEGAVEISALPSQIVAHSETGHHHILASVGGVETATANPVKLFGFGDRRFVQMTGLGELRHAKSGPHIHKTLKVNPGIYEVKKKGEFDYTLNLRREVMD